MNLEAIKKRLEMTEEAVERSGRQVITDNDHKWDIIDIRVLVAEVERLQKLEEVVITAHGKGCLIAEMRLIKWAKERCSNCGEKIDGDICNNCHRSETMNRVIRERNKNEVDKGNNSTT